MFGPKALTVNGDGDKQGDAAEIIIIIFYVAYNYQEDLTLQAYYLPLLLAYVKYDNS